jgi:alanyl-tRNA synthetase
MIVHLKKKPHQCNKCDKMFSRKADLTKHEESHKTQEQTVDQSAMEMAAQETTQQETSADAQQQAPTSAPVTEEVTRSMESLVDLLVLASEINAGFSGTVGVGVEAKEALLHIQNTVPEHHEEVILESGIQPTSAVTQSTGTAAGTTIM